MTEKSILPADVKQLPLAEKIEHLRRLAPHRVIGLEMIVNEALEEVRQQDQPERR